MAAVARPAGTIARVALVERDGALGRAQNSASARATSRAVELLEVDAAGTPCDGM